MRLAFLLFVVVGCQTARNDPAPAPAHSATLPAPAQSVAPSPAGCVARDGPKLFFPVGSLSPIDEDVDELLRTWFSRVLAGTREPSLSCAEASELRYRFLKIPTWDHPSFVRVELSPRAGDVASGTLSGSGGYDPGKTVTFVERRVSSLERGALLEAIERAGFWSMVPHDPTLEGHDGTRWVIEGRSGAAYHVVHRWSPEAGPFRELCERFARLGGVSDDPRSPP